MNSQTFVVGENGTMPTRATSGSAGYDLHTSVDFLLDPKRFLLVPTDVFLNLPYGIEGQIRPKSGLAIKHGITVLNSPGTIDSDYKHEIKVILVNFGNAPVFFQKGQKIAQLVFCDYYIIESADSVNPNLHTVRDGGFGSTGR